MEYNKEKNIFYEIDYSTQVLFYENNLPEGLNFNVKKINLKNPELKKSILEKYNLISLPALLCYKKIFYPNKNGFLDLKFDKKTLMFEEFEKIISNGKIVLFLKGDIKNPYCQFSKKVVDILKNAGVVLDDVIYYDVLMNDEMREEIKNFNEWPTFPQLFVDGKFVGGCDILKSMEEKNELLNYFN